MNRVPLWFERKFEFTFPVELLPNLLARLRGGPARVEDAVCGRQHAAMVKKVDGKWSAQEEIGHLLNLEPLWLTRVEDFVAGSEVLTPTDLQNRATSEACYNERDLGGILALFRAARGQLVTRVQRLERAAFTKTILHPRMKVPMRLVDHLYFVAEHDDHHLARVFAMLES